MGAGRVLCDDILRRRMRMCVLSVSSTVGRSVGRSVDPGTTSRHFGAETKKLLKGHNLLDMLDAWPYMLSNLKARKIAGISTSPEREKLTYLLLPKSPLLIVSA